jgi:hypothetical protein
MTQLDLANQTKGILPAANVEDLTQALIDIGTLQGESGGNAAWITAIEGVATALGYADFATLLGAWALQIELNREASGAGVAAGYIDPTP